MQWAALSVLKLRAAVNERTDTGSDIGEASKLSGHNPPHTAKRLFSAGTPRRAGDKYAIGHFSKGGPKRNKKRPLPDLEISRGRYDRTVRQYDTTRGNVALI